MDSLRTIEIDGYTIEIYPDEWNENPNDQGDDDSFLIFQHRDFTVQKEGFDARTIFDDGEKCKGYHVFRCYAYIHGGVALAIEHHNFPDAQWDVFFAGFFMVKRRKGTWTRQQALVEGKEMCKAWNKYLSGECYYYTVTDENDDVIHSCGGFEDIDACVDDAKEQIQYEKEMQSKHEKSYNKN